MFINIICILNIKYYMYFEYYLYTYFCLSVVILPCAIPGSIVNMVKQTVVKNQEE